MYLQSIHLTNIKSFRDAKLELPGGGGYAGWNVILGGNAAGKTTLLQAIALCCWGRARWSA
jgi:AAA15 family ATPase/GTPase